MMVDTTLWTDSVEKDRSRDDAAMDDHFRNLGYPPNVHKGRDAGFDNVSLGCY